MKTNAHYDPFHRGAFAVGVSSFDWWDESRNRPLPTEVWYPTSDDFVGQDLNPETCDWFYAQPQPAADAPLKSQRAVRGAPQLAVPKHLVVFAHGYAGHRREGTFLATHLASHGYVVVAADHRACTFWDIEELIAKAKAEGRKHLRTDHMAQLIEDRRQDIPYLIRKSLQSFEIDSDGIGVTGSSFGGLTALIAPALDDRVKAIVPMCPSGGETPIYPKGHNHAREALNFPWRTDVAVMFLVADRDSWLPLYGQIELFARVRGQKSMFVLRRANHNHFIDDIPESHEFLRQFTRSLAEIEADGGVDWTAVANSIPPYSETCPAEQAYECWRGLCVLHMDAYLKQHEDALAMLRNNVISEVQNRGIDVVEITADDKRSNS